MITIEPEKQLDSSGAVSSSCANMVFKEWNYELVIRTGWYSPNTLRKILQTTDMQGLLVMTAPRVTKFYIEGEDTKGMYDFRLTHTLITQGSDKLLDLVETIVKEHR